MEHKFDFDDLIIIPSTVTNIESRKDINITDDNGFLPIITAPMDTVVSDDNKEHFIKNKIYTISNRTENKIYSTDKFNWASLGLKEYKENYLDNDIRRFGKDIYYVLIDIANAHMEKLHDFVKLTKEKYGDVVKLIVGNIANPETYKLLSEYGVWGIRVGIGNGSGCLTSQNVSIGYPLASLIDECYKISCTLNNPAKIIADGGLRSYSDIIKALHLGANFCMVGGIFNKALESCADTYMGNVKHDSWTEPGKRINQYDNIYADMLGHGTRIFKKFRGMSTKEVQSKLKSDSDIKTSEGITRMNQVEYTLEGWTENFRDYLKSAMSYCNCKTLDEFIGMEQYVLITNNALERFRK